MTTQHTFQIKENKKNKFKEILTDCYRGYNDILAKINYLIEAKKDIDSAFDISINELKNLYEEERMVDVSINKCGNYEPRF